jgi:hypothetical protein
MTISAPLDQNEPSYAYKPSVIGVSWSFRLTPDAIVWNNGRVSGRTPFASITRVRMAFKPATTQGYRFVTHVWSEQGPKLTIVSTSWKSMMEQQRLDAAYATFVADLHRHIAAAGAPAIFDTGISPAIYWSGLIVYVAAGLGFAALIARGVQAGAWAGAGIVAVFFALFLWNGNYFRRNRPGHYRPDALPPMLVP